MKRNGTVMESSRNDRKEIQDSLFIRNFDGIILIYFLLSFSFLFGCYLLN